LGQFVVGEAGIGGDVEEVEGNGFNGVEMVMVAGGRIF
jgi:hypothetical protein